jgi:hypothetical protein
VSSCRVLGNAGTFRQMMRNIWLQANDTDTEREREMRSDQMHVKTLTQPIIDTESETETQFQRYYKIVNGSDTCWKLCENFVTQSFQQVQEDMSKAHSKGLGLRV